MQAAEEERIRGVLMIARLILIFLLTLHAAYAQRGGMNPDPSTNAPVRIGTSRLDIIEKMLALRKEQKKDVKLILDNAQKEAAPFRDRLIKEHLAIGDAIQAGKGEAEIHPLIDSHAASQLQMADVEFRAFAKIYQILDETQQSNSPALFRMMKGIFLEKNWNAEQ